jgi:hypothetical protein
MLELSKSDLFQREDAIAPLCDSFIRGREATLKEEIRVSCSHKRMLLVASAGGHWIELCRLSPAFSDFDCHYVSTCGGLAPPTGARKVSQIADGSRDAMHFLFRSATELWRIMREFRPDIVLSTGAAPGAVALLIGRILGARTIWIDSIANSDETSLSGRWARHFADLSLTQWRHLAQSDPLLTYFGQVL